MKKLLSIILLLAFSLTAIAAPANAESFFLDNADGIAEAKAHRERQIDLVFDWLEQAYPHYFPSHQESYYSGEFRTRYYPSNDGYLFVKYGNVHFYSYYEELEAFSLEFWLELSGIAAEQNHKEADSDRRRRQEEADSDRRRRQEEAEEINRKKARREAARKEADRQEAARKEAARKEAARKEAARKEAARKEAARQEAARQEAARKEAARQEAARREAARSRTSHQHRFKAHR